jgi:hypothetical protein
MRRTIELGITRSVTALPAMLARHLIGAIKAPQLTSLVTSLRVSLLGSCRLGYCRWCSLSNGDSGEGHSEYHCKQCSQMLIALHTYLLFESVE